MRAHIVLGTRGDTVSPWLQPNPNGCIFHVGPVLGLVRVSDAMRVVGEDDRTIIVEATLRAGERALVAVVASEDQPLGVPVSDDVDRRIDQSDTA